PCMKHVAGFANSAGTRITAVALVRLQSRRSGVVATEQIRTRAVSMSSLHSGSDKPELRHLSQTRLRLFVTRVTIGQDLATMGASSVPFAGRMTPAGQPRLQVMAAGSARGARQFARRIGIGRIGAGVLLAPLRARAAHVVALRPVGIEQVLHERATEFGKTV